MTDLPLRKRIRQAKMQSKRLSLMESVLNVSTGMILAMTITQLAVWASPYIPGFSIQITFASNVIISTILTVFSILRGYCWRRFFNNLENKT